MGRSLAGPSSDPLGRCAGMAVEGSRAGNHGSGSLPRSTVLVRRAKPDGFAAERRNKPKADA